MFRIDIINRRQAAEAFSSALVFAAPAAAFLPQLSGVRIQRRGDVLRVAATDRYVVGVFFLGMADRPGDDFDVLVPAADVKRVVALLKASKLPGGVCFDFSDDWSTVLVGDDATLSSVGVELYDKRDALPDLDRLIDGALGSVVERPDMSCGLTVDPALFAKLQKANGKLSVRLHFGEPFRPVLWTSEAGFGLVMPHRSQVSGVELPEWARPVRLGVAAAA